MVVIKRKPILYYAMLCYVILYYIIYYSLNLMNLFTSTTCYTHLHLVKSPSQRSCGFGSRRFQQCSLNYLIMMTLTLLYLFILCHIILNKPII